MKPNNKVLLRDLRPISEQEFDTSRRICEEIQRIVLSRDSYVAEHVLDPSIALPMSNWAEGPHNALYDLYRLVIAAKYDVINRLRLYTQPFSGYELASLQLGHARTSVPYPLPNDFDERFSAMGPDKYIERYINIAQFMPKEITARPPKILGEIGWDINGTVVNHDTYACQERLNLLYEAGIISWLRDRATAGNVSVLEIGAGYGGLAYCLKQIIPPLNYIICDLPESLLFSSLYLAIACPEYTWTIYDGTDKSKLGVNDHGLKFLPNFMFDDLLTTNISIDLAINTLSFSEMSENQVRHYGQGLNRLLGTDGILFEQNHNAVSVGFTYSKLFLPEYFKFRKTCKPKSVPGLLFGMADIWANGRIAEILSKHSAKVILHGHRGLRWWRFWITAKINGQLSRVIGRGRFDRFVDSIKSRPWAKRIIDRLV